MVKALLEAGASCASHSASGMTPLHEAAQAKREAVMQLLVAAPGAKLDSRNREGATPLHLAVKSVAVVRVLLQAGAAAGMQDGSGSLPIHVAADTGQDEALQSLLQADSTVVDVTDRQGRTAAYLATRGGHAVCLQHLLQLGASASLVRPDSGEGCLHAAAKDGHKQCLQALLEHGAPVMAANAEGDTPLHLAAQKQQAECVQLLLDAGARVDVTNASGVTPSDVIFQRRSAFSKELIHSVAKQQRMSSSRRGRRGRTGTGSLTASAMHGLPGIVEMHDTGTVAEEEEAEPGSVVQFQPLARNIDTLATCLPAACVPCMASFLVVFDAMVHFGDFWSDVVVAKQFFDSGDEAWGILASVILGISWGTTVFSVNLANSAAYSRGERGCRLLLAALGLFPAGLALGMRVVGKAEAVFFDQLRLLEVFVESIPELLLQTYVLVLITSQSGGQVDVSVAQVISLTLSLLSVANAVFDSRKADILSPSIPGLLEDIFARKPWGLVARWGVLLCTIAEVSCAIFLYAVFGSVFGPWLFVALGLPVLFVWAYTGYEFKRLTNFRAQNSWNDGVDSRISFLYHAGLTIVSGAGFLHGRGAARSDHLRHRILAIRLFGTQEHDALLFTAVWKTVFFLGPLLLCAVLVLRCNDATLHVCSSIAWRPNIIAALACVFAVHVLYFSLALFQRCTLLRGSPTAPVHVKSAQSSRGKSRSRGTTFTLPKLGLTPRNRRAAQVVTHVPLQRAPADTGGPADISATKSAPGTGGSGSGGSNGDGEGKAFTAVVPQLQLPAKQKGSTAPLSVAPRDVEGLLAAPVPEAEAKVAEAREPVHSTLSSDTQSSKPHRALGFKPRAGWSDASSVSITPTAGDSKHRARPSGVGFNGSLGAVNAAATGASKPGR